MKETTEYALKKLSSAVAKLKQGTEEADTELEQDGVVQRFEFTFELLWKTLKLFLEEKGIICKSPKDCLKEAFRMEWLNEEQVFLDMLEDRNRSSHIYDKEEAEQIFRRIKEKYAGAIEKVVEKLKKC